MNLDHALKENKLPNGATAEALRAEVAKAEAPHVEAPKAEPAPIQVDPAMRLFCDDDTIVAMQRRFTPTAAGIAWTRFSEGPLQIL